MSFTFSMRAIPKDPSGYYYPRWDKAQKLTVKADTKQEAINKADRMLGPNARRWPWSFIVDQIAESPEADNKPTEPELGHDQVHGE
ncbi:hypothetical protein [Arthrobacter russicus]|uniref:Uncharacterized protein n=1 Tax=Arthrobacter russicus TaxID=172040 RepID=A0ABU1JDV3_9MICC|nr:hypothetical protein [Arthrobacter russicus]MDR6270624.1 hypothetical protein [Arthrobacter russicus]